MDLTSAQRYAYDKRYWHLDGFHRMAEPSCIMADELERVAAIGRSLYRGFVIDKDNRFVYENMIRWVRCDDALRAVDPVTGAVVAGDVRKGIFLAGGLGVGKTLCMQVMNKYCAAIEAHYFHGGIKDFRLDMTDAFTVFTRYVSEGAVQQYIADDVLCVNDLGCEPVEATYMGTKLSPLRHIIEVRGDRPFKKVSVFTTNFPMCSEALCSRYGERVVSRLPQMCNYLILGGADRRR